MLGGGIFCLRRTGQSQWHGKHGPGRCGDRILCRGVLPLWSATSVRYRTEPALRCYPASSRERCVQRSLPCVSRSGKGKLSVRGPWPWAGGRYSLERLFAKEDKNRKSPLWKSPRLSEMGGSGIAVRLKWQSGSGCGDAPQEDFPAFFCRSRYTTMRDTMTSNTREIKMVPRFAAIQSSMKSTPFKKNGGGNYLVLSLVAS